MGCGTWTRDAFKTYSASKGRSVTSSGGLDSRYTAQDLYTSRNLRKELDPKNVMRECRDTEEHPNTIPVILALDVTGSMGAAAAECAKKLNEIMTTLYEKVTDVEFMVMGIGDLSYDDAPIQISQFESDIRIAEHLDKIYFEGGGGGNNFESYTAAWYMGLRHTDLDCWKRGKKGIIITLGDEPLNPYLPSKQLSRVTGDPLQDDVETGDLYRAVTEKYDIYHLAVTSTRTYENYYTLIPISFKKYLDDHHYIEVTLDNLSSAITDIVSNVGTMSESNYIPSEATSETVTSCNEISW